MKMIGNVSDWLSYAGGALIKVADPAGSTVCRENKSIFLLTWLIWSGCGSLQFTVSICLKMLLII